MFWSSSLGLFVASGGKPRLVAILEAGKLTVAWNDRGWSSTYATQHVFLMEEPCLRLSSHVQWEQGPFRAGVGFPLLYPLVLAGLLCEVFRRGDLRRISHSHACVECGYDLRGSAGDVCPECGASVKMKDHDSGEASPAPPR